MTGMCIPQFCSPESLDLNRSPIRVPVRFYDVPFNFYRYPGAPGVSGFTGGANCQLYAYEFLREHWNGPLNLRTQSPT